MKHALFSFEAHNPDANISRWYNVRYGKDLFGGWYVLSSWGRKGHKGGQMKEYVCSSPQDAYKKSISICKKRLNARSRIGCNYTCLNHSLTSENLEKILQHAFFQGKSV
jgi:predicted DNA-binding WGR domain protein